MKFRRQINLLKFLALAASMLWMCTAIAGGKPIKVETVEPNTAPPDITLDVVIGGSGFKDGDVVEFYFHGAEELPENTEIDVVESVPTKSNAKGTELTVKIKVRAGAQELSYDVVVVRSPGRRGKGTTLFSVKKGATPVVTLDITYEFGFFTDDDCDEPDCVSTVIRATAPVECGQTNCSFRANAQDAVFALPSGLRDLLSPPTKWRGTELDPDICFGSSDIDPVGFADLGTDTTGTDHNLVFLRRYNDGLSPWEASVGTFARDIDDYEDRPYIFNFEGCGIDGDCGDFAPGSMAGVYNGGELKRIDSHGNDKKFLSIPCRCTRSNTPNCPDDIVDDFGEPVPTPQIRITVEVP